MFSSVYINHFRAWLAKKHSPALAAQMPRYFILALEMMRQRSATRSVRLVANDPGRQLNTWVYLYFQWLSSRVLTSAEPLVIQPDVYDRKLFARRFPSVKVESLRTPHHVRAFSSGMVAVLCADTCRRCPNHDDRFHDALRAVIPMLNPVGSIAVFTGDASDPRMAFSKMYTQAVNAWITQGETATYIFYNHLNPAAVLSQLNIRFRRKTSHPSVGAQHAAPAPTKSNPAPTKSSSTPAQTQTAAPTNPNIALSQCGELARPRQRPQCKPILKIPLVKAAAAPAA